MQVDNIYAAMIIGTLLSLIYVEFTNVLPAGIVIPGYLALSLDNPISILGTFVVSTLTYFIVVHGISKVTILYGKRKFATMIVVAILLKMATDFVIGGTLFGPTELAALGVIVPGLIANTIQRQGVLVTLGSTTLMTLLTYSGVMLVQMIA